MADKGKKGDMADQLLLEHGPDGEIAIHNLLLKGSGSAALPQGTIPLGQFLDKLQRRYTAQATLLFGITPCGMSLRGMYQRHGVLVFLIEVAPGARTLKWLRNDSPQQYGAQAMYRDVTLALPYQYFFVAVKPSSGLSSHHSVYFLNQPLRSLTEPLGECHYFNCSVQAYGVHCWICIQNLGSSLPARPMATPLEWVGMFIEWFFGSSFNASSEHHEGRSFWGKNRDLIGDKRVSTVEKWEKATIKNPNFILEVPWLSSLSAQEVFEELTPAASSQPGKLRDLVQIMREKQL